MYQRNRLYITAEEQETIKNTRLLIAGAGLGSNIAECALRLGFENIVICDMDEVEASNLNRQNYTWFDLYNTKAQSLHFRLKSINPKANIECHDVFLTKDNCLEYISKCDIAINTIDFTSDAPFIFDDLCLQHNVPVLHPFNLGWTSCCFVINQESKSLKSIVSKLETAEVDIVEHIFEHCNKEIDLTWLENVLHEYQNENGACSPPQLSPASWFTGGLCANILFKIANKMPVRTFPDFYLIDA